ncbi:hypothetical protein GGR57DRAFT_478612 [Xylariaceae sp. FL1272]|nr:hypothetical protein GGR57DRAFT_478612 [Xylariaceae sp. FL1272]
MTEQPTIPSAYDSFESIRHDYDRAGKTTEALGYWQDAYPHQARLVLVYIVEAFAKIGCDLTQLQSGDAVPQVKALDQHQKLIRRFYEIIEDGKLISAKYGGFVRTDVPVNSTPAEAIYKEIIGLYAQHAVPNKLVRVVGSQFAGCLIGEVDGLRLVFGSMENKKLLSDMYEFWPLLRAPTLLLGDFLVKACSSATGKGKFRIHEVGAGTGGTTRHVIDRLQKAGVEFEYVFTDIGSALVVQAKRQFKKVPGMSFETLDIERAPNPEHEGAFHCIISTIASTPRKVLMSPFFIFARCFAKTAPWPSLRRHSTSIGSVLW